MGIIRTNKACKYFPCHDGLEDCTFCYCPFYPCLNEKRGRFIHSKKSGIDIWSCKDCNWIHKTKVVDNIFDMIRQNYPAPQIDIQKLKAKKTAIIILGHGTKLEKANKTILNIVKSIRLSNFGVITPAYLQFNDPNLPKSIKGVVEKGCERVVIVPFFLFMGNHVTKDIPKVIKEVKRSYPCIEFIYAKNIGEDSRIENIVRDRIREAINKCR